VSVVSHQYGRKTAVGQVAPELSIVVPLRNEGPNVQPLALRVFEVLGHLSGGVELILVDDGSNDDTWECIIAAQQQEPRIRALRHGGQAGQSAALWTGFRASRGQVIGTLDGDLQNDPADFPAMLAELTSCDMVTGVRTRRMDSRLKRISTAVARWARRLVLGVDFRDSACNLRVFKSSVLELLLPFDGIHRFMPILAQRAGAIVRQIPVNHHPRMKGLTKYGVWNRLGRGVVDLMMVRWLLQRQFRSSTTIEVSPDTEPFGPPVNLTTDTATVPLQPERLTTSVDALANQ